MQSNTIIYCREIFSTTNHRWEDTYFPFTEPSFELQSIFKNEELEMLGSGVIHDKVLQNAGKDPTKVCGWAFGIGIDRWAMKLFEIPDIKV